MKPSFKLEELSQSWMPCLQTIRFLLVNPSKTNRNTIVVPCTLTVSRVLVQFQNKRDFPILRVD